VTAFSTPLQHGRAPVQLLFRTPDAQDASGHAEDSVQMTSVSLADHSVRLSDIIEVVRVGARC
jgi:hypothetical protein